VLRQWYASGNKEKGGIRLVRKQDFSQLGNPILQSVGIILKGTVLLGEYPGAVLSRRLHESTIRLVHLGHTFAVVCYFVVFTPLIFAAEDIAANGFSFILSMNLGTAMALPDGSARF